MRIARIIAALVAVAAVALTACGKDSSTASSDAAAASGDSNKGQFVARYEAAEGDLRPIQQMLQNAKLLETVAEDSNGLLKLPSDISVVGKSCGVPNAFWTPDDQTITMCYEYADMLQRAFAKDKDQAQSVDKEVIGAMTAVYYHELGHAVISTYQLPVTGREEDAVDQLSVVILSSGPEEMQQMILTVADAWRRMAADDNELNADTFADEHSLNAQREYNFMCWAYGSNPDKYASMVSNGQLPEARAERCPQEFDAMQNAWSVLLSDHLK
ncbi:DUF4344 domain-containing metallopeptidase [Nocardia sp. NPDC049149]|uniref:DUF4344 domain-containing metallopeptidase n=1 Tax=Nocardia sp. NPDC049149 TaxID=3364315 RepID=UPI00372218AE